MIRRNLTALLIILSISSVVGGDIKKEIVKINEAYLKIKNLSAHLEYRLYRGLNAMKPIEIKSGDVKKNGRKSHTSLGNMEIIKNDSEAMIIDHNRKTILISMLNNENEKLIDDRHAELPNIDNLLKNCASSKLSYSKNEEILKFTFKDSRMAAAEISFAPESYVLKNMTIYYGEPVTENEIRIVLSYSDFNTAPKFGKSTFSFSGFVKINRSTGQYEATNAYKTYRVFNYNLSDQ